MDTASTIANGARPEWQDTFTHPEHGKLTFTAEMPTGADWLNHAMLQETLAPGLTQGIGALLAAATAGLQTIITSPVIAEEREEDPDNPDHVKIRQIRYDPLVDPNTQFPIDVWMAFHRWRVETLSEHTKDAVKNSSAATSGDTAAAASPATSDSQPTA